MTRNRQTLSLGPYQEAFAARQRLWRQEKGSERLWQRDASLWTGSDEGRWLAWLDVAERELARVAELESLALEAAEFDDAVVLGMGGSSLCPDVLARSFGRRRGYPRLHVLDSTVPAQILELEAAIHLEKTLFVVASKSGSTAEPNAFEKYFFGRSKRQFPMPSNACLYSIVPVASARRSGAIDRSSTA